jgi:hypothetical protein
MDVSIPYMVEPSHLQDAVFAAVVECIRSFSSTRAVAHVSVPYSNVDITTAL